MLQHYKYKYKYKINKVKDLCQKSEICETKKLILVVFYKNCAMPDWDHTTARNQNSDHKLNGISNTLTKLLSNAAEDSNKPF